MIFFPRFLNVHSALLICRLGTQSYLPCGKKNQVFRSCLSSFGTLKKTWHNPCLGPSIIPKLLVHFCFHVINWPLSLFVGIVLDIQNNNLWFLQIIIILLFPERSVNSTSLRSYIFKRIYLDRTSMLRQGKFNFHSGVIK